MVVAVFLYSLVTFLYTLERRGDVDVVVSCGVLLVISSKTSDVDVNVDDDDGGCVGNVFISMLLLLLLLLLFSPSSNVLFLLLI